VSQLYIDNVDQDLITQTAWYDTWDDSTNSTKGYVVVRSRSAGGTQVTNVFRVTGSVTVATGYYKIPVAYVSGSIPSNGAELVIDFGRSGDVGAQGAQGATGSTGAQGVQGATGTTGAQGAQGAQGFQGVQGATGPSTTINATLTTGGTQYKIVGVPSTGSNQTVYANTSAYFIGNTLYAYDFAATSDAKLKNVVRNIQDPINKVNSINGVEYYWKSDTANTQLQIGVLAQEIANIAPSAVYLENGTMHVSYDRIIPVLIEAVKELSARVKKLEEK
jgi:hypothetical protein